MVKQSEQPDHIAFARGGCDTWIRTCDDDDRPGRARRSDLARTTHIRSFRSRLADATIRQAKLLGTLLASRTASGCGAHRYRARLPSPRTAPGREPGCAATRSSNYYMGVDYLVRKYVLRGADLGACMASATCSDICSIFGAARTVYWSAGQQAVEARRFELDEQAAHLRVIGDGPDVVGGARAVRFLALVVAPIAEALADSYHVRLRRVAAARSPACRRAGSVARPPARPHRARAGTISSAARSAAWSPPSSPPRRRHASAGSRCVAPPGIPCGSRRPGRRAVARGAVRRVAELPTIVADALRTGPISLLHGAVYVSERGLRTELGAIRAPTLLVWGGARPARTAPRCR